MSKLFNIPDVFNDEEWRDIVGFEGRYQVSNLGRIKSLNRIGRRGQLLPGKLKKPTGNRYLGTTLELDGKTYNKLVHRLVAEAFIPNPDSLPEVNHIDGDITNNKVENLEWCTASANHAHGVSHRKSYSYRKQVKCLETGEIFASISAAGRSVNADATQIVESIEAQRCCKEFTFAYMDDLPSDEVAYVHQAHAKYQNFHRRPVMGNAKKVRIIETGQEFDSIASAAKFIQCDTATISNRIKEHRTVDGVTLEFVID